MLPTREELVDRYQLQPHPEGGHFRETYRAPRGANGRSASTAIYFLLPKGARSKLHRLKSDEVWHFYLGGPLVVVEISPKGQITETRLGHNHARGEVLQHVVPAGHWFGAYPATGSAYSFVGCTVAPGFEFDEFELAQREELVESYPHADGIIRLLT
jgi:predicted cupin superfamily sugar epimerase